jgi:OmcA/MtrC family decaheme c-type cytochrome
MRYKPLTTLCGVLLSTAAALVMVGCNGKTGAAGANGTNGTNGNNGGYALDATTLSTSEWEELSLNVNVTKAAVVAGKPTVDFTVVDQHNTPLKGFGFKGQNPASDPYPVYLNMGFSIAKLIPEANGAPSRWVSYIVTSNPTLAAPTTWVPTRPTTDSIGDLVDHGDGTYTYTFRRDISQTQAQLDAYTYTGANAKADLDNVAYDPTLTHRLTVYVGGSAWGTGSNTATRANTGLPGVPVKFPANVAYDFIPQTGAPITASNARRDIVDVTSCFSCHAKFEFHGEGRQDTKYCVVCHNDQRKYGYANSTEPFNPTTGQRKIADRAVGDFPSFIHKLHMGEELSKPGYQYAGVLFNEVTYPQDHRNCVKCHTASTATPQGDNWFNRPNRMACGGCHDNIDFATGTNSHPGGAAHSVQTSDAACAGCHTAADIKTMHIPIVPPNPANIWATGGTNNNTNASYVAAFTNNLPVGADVVTWDLKSVTLNASAKPVFTFRFLKNGTPVVFQTYAAGSVTEMMPNFVGGPSFYIAFTVPQDGIATPADWNATASTYLKNIWRGDNKDMAGATLAASAQGTLSATPDGNGYYTLTMTGVNIPTTATMITGGIGYTYGLTLTQPLTQTNVPGYPYVDRVAGVPDTGQGGVSVPAPNVTKLVSGTLPAGFSAQAARRVIVANNKCNDCHGALGVFTAKSYHGGQRNDANTCEFCHNGQRVNSGWGVNAKDFVHAIHGAGKRANKFSWESTAGMKYWTVTYPSVLNNCEACHLPGTYDFGRAANAAAVPNLLWTTVATGTTPNPMNVVVTGNETIPGVYWSQWSKTAAAAANAGVPEGYNFGSGFSYNASTGATTAAAGTTLVNSPYVAACSNCHDSTLAIDHMKTNGGSFYATRASVQVGGVYVKQEQCFLCHSAGKIADTEKVHMNFR